MVTNNSRFDLVEFAGGTQQWCRPVVNNSAFYDFGSWEELDPPEPWIDFGALGVGGPPFGTFAVRRDSNGQVFIRGVLSLPTSEAVATALEVDEVDFDTYFTGGMKMGFLTLDSQYRPQSAEIVTITGTMQDLTIGSRYTAATMLIVNPDGSTILVPGEGPVPGTTWQDVCDGISGVPAFFLNINGRYTTLQDTDIEGPIPTDTP